MPVITIDIGIMESREKKDELVKSLTKAASSVTQIPENKFIVLINEMEKDNIGVGGRLLSDIMKG
jgi:4-oxalocrotonate tautomerase